MIRSLAVAEFLFSVVDWAVIVTGSLGMIAFLFYLSVIAVEKILKYVGFHRAMIAFFWQWYQGLRWDKETGKWYRKEEQ